MLRLEMTTQRTRKLLRRIEERAQYYWTVSNTYLDTLGTLGRGHSDR